MKDKQWISEWKEEIIAAALLLGFAFFINRGIEIKGLYMEIYIFGPVTESSLSVNLYSLWEAHGSVLSIIWRPGWS